MAVISVKHQGHRSTSNRTKDEKTATEFYIVRYDAPATSVAAETATDGTNTIPAMHAGHAGDSSRKVVAVNAKAIDEGARKVFEVQVDYSDASENTDNPLAQPTQYAWDFSTASEVYFKDHSDTPKATANSAGEPFENLLERETGCVVVTITKNIAANAFDPADAADVMFPTATNSDSLSIDGVTIGAGQARMGGISCTATQTQNSVSFRTLTTTLKLAPSWEHVVEDRGFNELSSGKLKEISKGTPPTKPDRPWPLNGSGAAASAADATPAELTFKPYPAKALAGYV